jgi:hypothetical protein
MSKFNLYFLKEEKRVCIVQRLFGQILLLILHHIKVVDIIMEASKQVDCLINLGDRLQKGQGQNIYMRKKLNKNNEISGTLHYKFSDVIF